MGQKVNPLTQVNMPYIVANVYPNFFTSPARSATAGNSYSRTENLPRAVESGEVVIIVPTIMRWCTVQITSIGSTTFSYQEHNTINTAAMVSGFSAIYFKPAGGGGLIVAFSILHSVWQKISRGVTNIMPQKINRTQVSDTIAFKATRSSNLSTTAGSSINFICDNEYYDYGDCYDTSTGLFTAPYDGIYEFKAVAYTETTATTRNFFQPRGTAGIGGERSRDLDSAANRRADGTWETFMTAGQTFGLNLWTSQVNNLNNTGTWFSGHLVMRT